MRNPSGLARPLHRPARIGADADAREFFYGESGNKFLQACQVSLYLCKRDMRRIAFRSERYGILFRRAYRLQTVNLLDISPSALGVAGFVTLRKGANGNDGRHEMLDTAYDFFVFQKERACLPAGCRADADIYPIFSRLHEVGTLLLGKGRHGTVRNAERERLCFPRLQKTRLFKFHKFDGWLFENAVRFFQIYLYRLSARTAARVDDFGTELQSRPVIADGAALYGKLGIGEPPAKGETDSLAECGKITVADVYPLLIDGVEPMIALVRGNVIFPVHRIVHIFGGRNIFIAARPGVGKLAGRIDLARQHVDDRLAASHSAVTDIENGVHAFLFQPVRGKRISRIENDDDV